MKKIIFLLFSFFLVACFPVGGVSGVTPAQAIVLATQPQPIQPTGTPTIVPTATLDHAATLAAANVDTENMRQAAYQAQQEALNYQNTSIAAGVIIVQITAQYEQQQVVIMQATQEADRLTAQSNMWTVTAQPTADSIRATDQAFMIIQNNERAAQRTQEANAPALIVAKADAEYAAKLGWVNYAAIALVSSVFCLLMVWIMMYLNQRPQSFPAGAAEEEPEVIREVHYHKTQDDGQYKLERMQTQVPCTTEQLMVLADGIRNRGMTLAINQWQGTIAHKSIDPIREFMKPPSNNFAHEIKSKNGELTMTTAGEDWLDECLALGDAPLPYKTISPPPVS